MICASQKAPPALPSQSCMKTKEPLRSGSFVFGDFSFCGLRRREFDLVVAHHEGPLELIVDAEPTCANCRRVLWIIDPGIGPITGVSHVGVNQWDGYADAVAVRDIRPGHVAALPKRVLAANAHAECNWALGCILDDHWRLWARSGDVQWLVAFAA